LLCENINIKRNNTEALLKDSKEVGLQANAEKTKYMVVSRHQNAGQNHSLLIANKSFDNMAKVQVLGNNSKKSKFHS
jgi:hypothetical protein